MHDIMLKPTKGRLMAGIAQQLARWLAILYKFLLLTNEGSSPDPEELGVSFSFLRVFKIM